MSSGQALSTQALQQVVCILGNRYTEGVYISEQQIHRRRVHFQNRYTEGVYIFRNRYTEGESITLLGSATRKVHASCLFAKL